MRGVLQTPDRPSTAFTERFVRSDGLQVRYWEAGHGQPVVILTQSGDPSSLPLSNLLAAHFRILIFDISGLSRPAPNAQPFLPRNLARSLARATIVAGLERYALVSTSADGAVALWHALDLPQPIEALVLISPTLVLSDQTQGNDLTSDPELARRLEEIKVPVLLLVGTEDQALPRETGPIYVERMSNCYYVLVYDAGRVIETERPDALFAVVRDFLERRDTFIVKPAGTAVNP